MFGLKQPRQTPSIRTALLRAKMSQSYADLTLEDIIDNEQSRASFRKFLVQTLNEDPLLFIETVENYERMKSHHNRFDCAKDIMRLFIEPRSKNELNISQSTRDNTLNQFKTSCSATYCPKTLFESCCAGVMLELKEDVWPRFQLAQRTMSSTPTSPSTPTQAFKTGSTTDATSDLDSDSNSYDEITSTSISSIDPSSPHFSDDEIKLIKEWSISEKKIGNITWHKVLSKPEFQSFVTKKPVSVMKDSRKGLLCKVVGIIDAPVDICLQAATAKKYKLNDEMLKVCENLAYIPGSVEHPYAVSIVRERYSIPLISDREFVISCTLVTENVQPQNFKRYILCRKSIPWNDCIDGPDQTVQKTKKQKTNTCIKAEMVGCYIYEQYNHENTKTRYTEFGWVDMKGSIPLWLWNMTLKNRGTGLHAAMKKSVAEHLKATNGKGGEVENLNQTQTLKDHFRA